LSRLAVNVLVIVAHRVEGDERLACFLSARAQELIEHLLPGGGVHGSRLGQDAIQVEQAAADCIRKSEHAPSL
jgi:hypothetical protein